MTYWGFQQVFFQPPSRGQRRTCSSNLLHLNPNLVLMVCCLEINNNIRTFIEQAENINRNGAEICKKTGFKLTQHEISLNIHRSDLPTAQWLYWLDLFLLLLWSGGVWPISPSVGCIMSAFSTAAGYVFGCQVLSKKKKKKLIAGAYSPAKNL